VVAVLVIAVPVGIYFAVFGALWYGALDAGQHAILRLMLRGRGAIPSRLPRFLDCGTRLIFLQRGRRRLPLCPRITHGAHRRPWRWGHELGRNSERGGPEL